MDRPRSRVGLVRRRCLRHRSRRFQNGVSWERDCRRLWLRGRAVAVVPQSLRSGRDAVYGLGEGDSICKKLRPTCRELASTCSERAILCAPELIRGVSQQNRGMCHPRRIPLSRTLACQCSSRRSYEEAKAHWRLSAAASGIRHRDFSRSSFPNTWPPTMRLTSIRGPRRASRRDPGQRVHDRVVVSPWLSVRFLSTNSAGSGSRA